MPTKILQLIKFSLVLKTSPDNLEIFINADICNPSQQVNFLQKYRKKETSTYPHNTNLILYNGGTGVKQIDRGRVHRAVGVYWLLVDHLWRFG